MESRGGIWAKNGQNADEVFFLFIKLYAKLFDYQYTKIGYNNFTWLKNSRKKLKRCAA